jgi:hypothetical protein
MDVDQNKFRGPIIITALVLGNPVGANGYTHDSILKPWAHDFVSLRRSNIINK